MIKSMTGYGRAQQTINNKTITTEIRSVNHRYFDCTVKAPRAFGFLEESLKSYLQGVVSRGKIDVYISIDLSAANNVVVNLNNSVLDAYLSVFEKIESEYGIKNDITISKIANLNDIFTFQKTEEDADALCTDVKTVLSVAIADYNTMREREGGQLSADIKNRAGLLETMLEEIERRSPQVVAEYRNKLEARMREVLNSVEIDESRVITEAAIFADKIAIAEETVRLRSHFKQLDDMLGENKPVGRKLDFLIQEFNREANTIGSKANDAAMATIIVEFKAEIEKIREQIQNIE